MEEKPEFICVNCGEPAAALYKIYGPSVLKLAKCEKCKGVVDKYIEYDTVVVMVDLALMSKEAQRHVIYNTKFRSYWKLIIILMMLETYTVWRNDSLFNIFVNTVCNIRDNSTLNYKNLNLDFKFYLSETWKRDCKTWAQDRKEGFDLFIWEKDFYLTFLTTFIGNVAYFLSNYIQMTIVKQVIILKEVSALQLVKAFALQYAGSALVLPALVWRAADSQEARALHYLLVFVYCFTVYYNVLSVLYDCPKIVSSLGVLFAHSAKYEAVFHFTAHLRRKMY